MKKIIIFSAVLSIIFIAFSSQGVFAEGPGKELFIDAFMSEEIIVDQEKALLNPTIVRSRYVKIDFEYLAGKEYLRGADNVILNLFFDISLTAKRERFEKRGIGDRYTWFGRIEGVNQGQVIMVVENGHMAANIHLPDGDYQVRSIGNGIHAIREIDQSAFPDEEPPALIDVGPVDTSEPLSIAEADDGSIIDVMIVYTADAASGGNILSEIQLAIDETNASYANSGINPRLNLVHTQQITYTESGNIATDRNRLQNPSDGYMDNVHDLRDTYGADLVGLWVANGGGYCGIAYIMTTVSTSFENYGFMVVARSCATGYYSFGHEFGHIQSARHDWYVDSTNNSPYTYNHGYVYTPSPDWRTVMAYSNACSGCTRLQYWSNPDVLYSGVPMGVPEGTYHAADNRKTLNNTASTVANFRQSVDYEITLIDSYGLVWRLNRIGSSSRGLAFSGVVDMGSEERNAVATYLSSNKTLSMSADEGSGVAFNCLYRWSGGGGSGAWINISPSAGHGTITVSLSSDVDLTPSTGPKPGIEQAVDSAEAYTAMDPYLFTDNFGYGWSIDVIDSNSTALYLSGTVVMGSETRNAVAIYLKSSSGVSKAGDRGSGIPFNYNYRWNGSGGPGIWINISSSAGHGHVDVTLTGDLESEPNVKSNGRAPGVETQ